MRRFAILVERHGPMVLGVCRGILGPCEDVDDVFQATFLILIRKAASIRKREAVGPWLHGVAVQVARRVRLNSARRAETGTAAGRSGGGPRHRCTPAAIPSVSNLIHDELERLPERYRVPLILCCLEELSYERAAHELGLSEPALRGRLHRGRQKLEHRLRAKGIGLHSLLAAWRSRLDRSPVSLALQESTVRLAYRSPGQGGTVASALSASTVSLAEGVMQTMFWSSIKTATVASVMTASLAGAIVLGPAGPEGRGSAGESPRLSERPRPRRWSPESKRPQCSRGRWLNAERWRRQRRVEILDLLDQKIPLQLPANATLEDFLKGIKQATTKDGYSGIPIYVNPLGLTEANQTMNAQIAVPGGDGWPIGHEARHDLASPGPVLLGPRRIPDDRLPPGSPGAAFGAPRAEARPDPQSPGDTSISSPELKHQAFFDATIRSGEL